MPLREAHDIGQELQDMIEQVDQVERCFVHLDWEASEFLRFVSTPSLLIALHA